MLLFSCNICNKEFNTALGVNGHKRLHGNSKGKSNRQSVLYKNILKKQNKELLYYENPKFCQSCNSIIPLCKRINEKKFCNKSCAVTYNNSLRAKPKELKTRKKYIRTIKPKIEIYKKELPKCKHCSKIVKNRKSITCGSEVCKSILRFKTSKRGFYKGIHCDSTYELAFLIYHLDHQIKISRSELKLPYVYNNITYHYNPDFEINDTIYEIKGRMDDKAIAKHEQYPDIILLRKNDIKQYLNYVKQKYDVVDISVLYD